MQEAKQKVTKIVSLVNGEKNVPGETSSFKLWNLMRLMLSLYS